MLIEALLDDAQVPATNKLSTVIQVASGEESASPP
jgi:hypothetical protein